MDDDQNSLFSVKSIKTGPDIITSEALEVPGGHVILTSSPELVHRVRALTLQLLPFEVSIQSLKEPTSKIITPRVVDAYVKSAGDFVESLPFSLLRARQTFLRDASYNISDWDENMGRAIACEVLARRIVHNIGPDRLHSIMSTRYRYHEHDESISSPASALEFAIDTHCSIFLSSSESQLVITSLWEGRLVQVYNEEEDIDYVPFEEVRKPGFFGHFEPSRLSVPRYQNIFRIVIWLFFLLTYSQAVRQPLERLDSRHQSLEVWEYILYIMTSAFTLEEFHKLYTATRLFSWRAGFINFWTVISVITLTLLSTAFVLRMIGLFTDDENGTQHLRSFQVLSCVAPLIWMRIITVFDGAKYIGTMQICVGRMLQESTIFFALLALLFAGFFQAMVALDASDGETERSGLLINTLVQAMLQSPDYETSGNNSYGLILYYFWNFATSVILLNILVSLFASAYQDVVDDAEAQYLAFFAGKTIAMIRAPDQYVYPPPFNLIEMVFVAPLEFVLSNKNYAKLNENVMLVLFSVPLTVLAVCEILMGTKSAYIRNWFGESGFGDEDSPESQNPEVNHEGGLKISKVQFNDLIKEFPNPLYSSDETILHEIHALQRRIEELAAKITDGKI